MDIISPDSGSVKIFGKAFDESALNNIGYLPEERGLYRKMCVLEILVYLASLKDVDSCEASGRAEFYLGKFNLRGCENKKIDELSKGMQQKVQFIASILHDPGLLILDEPFSGLDPISTKMIKDEILDMKNKGKTILLSTHMMEKAEVLCGRILLINNGVSVLYGSLSEIKKKFGKNTISVEFNGEYNFTNPMIKKYNLHNNSVEILLEENAKPQDLIIELVKHTEIKKFELTEPSLNEIFIDAVTKSNETKEFKK